MVTSFNKTNRCIINGTALLKYTKMLDLNIKLTSIQLQNQFNINDSLFVNVTND